MQGQRAGKTLYHLNIKAEKHPIQIETVLHASCIEPLTVWHQRFCHLNNKTVLRMASLGATTGLGLFNDQLKSSDQCKGCLLGKMHRLPFKSGRQRATTVGQLIHSDVCGPMQVATPGGCRYFVTFKDDFSGWCVTRLLKNKSDVAAILQEFVTQLESETGKKVKTIRTDNGGEYIGRHLETWLTESGIRHECSVPYTPQQNGVAERLNRTIMEAVRSQMHSMDVPLELWGEAVISTTYVINRSISSLDTKTPFEIWYGRKPNVSHLRVFGCLAYVHTPDTRRRKLDPKAVECIMVGYCEKSKAYRTWDPVTRKIMISRDIIFKENSKYKKSTEVNESSDYFSILPLTEKPKVIYFGINN